MAKDDEMVIAIAAQIRNYLIAHPDAADSVAGIHRWWLQRNWSAERSSVIEKALEQLVDDGYVHALRLPDGTTVYGRRDRSSMASW